MNIVKVLFDHSADANIVEYINESSPLHFAAIYNNEEITSELLLNGADALLVDTLHATAENVTLIFL